jgi:hypothetical protein
MALEVLLLREGSKLVAADPISYDAIQSIRAKERVTASIRRSRNPRHHAKLFALLQVVFENQKQCPTVHDLLNALKLATGLFETGMTIDKVPYVVPQSIAFASMTQDRFEQWYDRAVEVILTKILPAANRKELDDRVHQILDGYHAQ